jgi:hypothetical protein
VTNAKDAVEAIERLLAAATPTRPALAPVGQALA